MSDLGQAVQVDSQPKDIKQNAYYQKIQQELAQKAKPDQANGDNQNETAKSAKVAEAPKPMAIAPVEDTVEIKSELNWKKDSEGNLRVEAELSHITAGSTATRMARATYTPYAINLATKTGQIMDSYSKQFIQARSHNVLYAKLAQMKCGFLLTLMGIMGVSWHEIEKLQKEALKGAVDDNLSNFEENEYNSEMLQVVSMGKDLQKQLMVIDDVRQQLVKQMKNFGEDYAYTAIKVSEIQREQCKKVLDTFVQERENLNYQLDFM